MVKLSAESWSEIEIQDLLYAYRKAKADCFFERATCTAKQFVEYEANLPENLARLLDRLKAGEIESILVENLGKPRILAKRLATHQKVTLAETSHPHSFFSDPERAFLRLVKTHTLTPEFRLTSDFPVTMHILSALWINLIGHRFDACLSQTAYGSRLRRYRSAPAQEIDHVPNYHINAIGSFEPYFRPYKQWRENGLRAIRRELLEDKSILAISLDLKSYYHKIDSGFIANQNFHKTIGLELNEWEYSFTRAFSHALKVWAEQISQTMIDLGCEIPSNHLGGLPIGLSISRILANVLLLELDRDIEEGLTPVYYGRYIDDLFLVLRDPKTIKDTQDLISFFAARTKCFAQANSNTPDIELKLPSIHGSYAGETSLILQQSKQKLFFLQGQGGIDLLDNIESQIRSVSSERRLMPDPDALESMASAKILTATDHPSEEADTLRRADGLSVRRLGWSIQLRSVEILANDLRRTDWKTERTKFYDFSRHHILRPDKILDHLDHLPRLLSLAVSLEDWSDAIQLLDSTFRSLLILETSDISDKRKINGEISKSGTNTVWAKLRETIHELAADAILRSLRWSKETGKIYPLSDAALALCNRVGIGENLEGIYELALAFRESDLAKIPYKDHLRYHALQQRQSVSEEESLWEEYPYRNDLNKFLSKNLHQSREFGEARLNPRCQISDSKSSLLPYIFPTRPYLVSEISLFHPEECIFAQEAAKNLAAYVRAIRGISVRASSIESQLSSSEMINKDFPIAFLNGSTDSKIRLGISSLLTKKESFDAGAVGNPDLSLDRYKRIERLVNAAIKAYPKPTHLLLPELALPERWIGTVSRLLQEAKISLISGVDYQIERDSSIHSSAVLVLADSRLGFPAFVQIRQAKILPAVGEEEELLHRFGKIWTDFQNSSIKPIYVHQGFSFGVLVCSELQNMNYRLHFQGRVDCVMVLSWNQDLDTFSSLVEAASLDVHAHIALVNNRKYGDSRVRSPSKEKHRRDLCRVRGGENEHVLIAELNINDLRAFQSRKKRWSRATDPFKPLPEGFTIAKFRETIPL